MGARDWLSHRETELLQLLADGCSQKEAAERMNISYGTVKDYTKNIRVKFDSVNTTHAVARALRRGYIE